MGLEIIGAGLQHRASKKAASAQKEAAYEANQTARDISAEQMDLYKQIYNEQKAQQAPCKRILCRNLPIGGNGKCYTANAHC